METLKKRMKRGLCLTGMSLLIAGGFIGSVHAEGKSITINSKGRFLYTDVETGQTVLMDAEDFTKIAGQLTQIEEEVNNQKTTVNNYSKQFTEIINDLTDVENTINRLDSEVNVKVDRWDDKTQSLYLVPVQ